MTARGEGGAGGAGGAAGGSADDARPFRRLTPPQGIVVAPGAVASPPPAVAPEALRVLVIEADAAERAAAVAAVRAAGHAVVGEAADPRAGAATLAEVRPDVVLLDCDHEPAAALAFARAVRADGAAEAEEDALDDEAALTPAPYLLAIVTEGRALDLRALLDAGVDDFLNHPATAARLEARLVIAGGRLAQVDARRRAERALARAQWLAGIGETSIAIQHEINNPLAALLGHAALIEHGLVEPGEEREILGVIVEQAHRIGAVIKRLAALRDPKTVEYLRGARMLDLSKGEPKQD